MFGLVHGRVGGPAKSAYIGAVQWVHADAHAGGDIELVIGHLERVLQDLGQSFRHGPCSIRCAHGGHNQHEFVATHAGQRVRRAHARVQALGDLFQQRVPGVVTQRVIDVFESIQVDIDHAGHQRGLARASDGILQPIGQEQAIRKPSQGIVPCQMRQLLFGVLSFPDIARDQGDSGNLTARFPNWRDAEGDGYGGPVASNQGSLREAVDFAATDALDQVQNVSCRQ